MSTDASIYPGQVLLGKYQLVHELGRGGMGVVYEAINLDLDKPVAVKVLLTEDAAATTIGRFKQEARNTAKLASEHIAQVIDIGMTDASEPFMVMELLRGFDLATHLHTSGPMPTTQAVDLVLQACVGIAEAHASGIVHRDLKPSNLFLAARPDGTNLLKVLDFGISKVISSEASSHAVTTQTNAMLGSPGYMSPEQIRNSKNVDQRTDVWSLGIILYELLTNAPPFQADSLTALIASIVSDAPIPLRDRRPDVPPGLEAVILGCLQKAPNDRTPSVEALVRGLIPYASPEGILTGQKALAVNQLGSGEWALPFQKTSERSGIASRTPALGMRSRRNHSRVGLIAGAGAAGLTVAAVGLLVVWNQTTSIVPEISDAMPVATTSAPVSTQAPQGVSSEPRRADARTPSPTLSAVPAAKPSTTQRRPSTPVKPKVDLSERE